MSPVAAHRQTQVRELKFKRAKLRPLDYSQENFFDVDYVVAFIAEHAYSAVAVMFPWLSVHQIKQPPARLMDAKFARQIAIHIMVERMNVPQRQVARLQARQRTSIHFALQTVSERLECPKFAKAYGCAADQTAKACQDAANRYGYNLSV